MADYLSTNTYRLRVLQIGPRGTHKMTFRGAPAASEATIIATARAVVQEMAAFCLDGTEFISAEAAAEGSDVFLPVTWGASIVGYSGVSASNTVPYGLYLNWPGRSTAGSRVAYYLFNIAAGYMTANNRLTVAESAQVAAVKDALEDIGSGLVAIDQNTFVMKTYANSGINDRVAKKSRSLA